jgi:GntR family transcriptional regulator
MERKINYDSPVPASRQVAAWLKADIENGVYTPGQRLPSIATLVQTFGIARDTALKAQRVLIAEGLAENSPGMGLFVATPGKTSLGERALMQEVRVIFRKI